MSESSEDFLMPKMPIIMKRWSKIVVDTRGKSGFVFYIHNARGEKIATSKVYSTRAGAKKSAMTVATRKYKVVDGTKS